MSEAPRTVISAIIERTHESRLQVLVQTRWKPDKSPLYSGLLEIPSGGVNAFENVYLAIRRETLEESGIVISRIQGEAEAVVVSNIVGEKAQGFQPFYCQQVLQTVGGLPWLGFVFLCEGDGIPLSETDETKDAQWMDIAVLRNLINAEPAKIFPLQLPVLQYYLQYRI